MSTSSKLNKTTNIARKALIVFLVFAISTFLFQFIFESTDKQPERFIPTPLPKSPYLSADKKLGEIPLPEITSLPTNPDSKITYSIQDQAILPDFPEAINIYEINKPREKLGNNAKGSRVATKLSLPSVGRVIKDNVTLWQSPDTSRSLTYDKLLEQWNYETDLTKEVLDIKDKSELKINPNTDFYDKQGLSILSSLTLTDNYFNKGKGKTTFIDYNQVHNIISTVANPKYANYVFIRQYKSILLSKLTDNYQSTKDQIPYTDVEADIRNIDYNAGIVNIIARGNAEKLVPDIVYFHYRQLHYGEKGTYNALSSKDAFLKLQKGEGILYWLKLKGEDPFSKHTPLSTLEYKVNADKVSIIYIEPEDWIESSTWTHYLQPYYLFEGTVLLTDGREADFATILPALQDAEYIK